MWRYQVLRLLKFFRGIKAIIGAIEYNLNLLGSVIGFMAFFFVIFGIVGMGIFQGALMHRCVIAGPAKVLALTLTLALTLIGSR